MQLICALLYNRGWGTCCVCYHGPHEWCIIVGGPQNPLILC